MRSPTNLLAVLALAGVVAAGADTTALAQTSQATSSPAQRIVGSAPALPPPTTVGWIEEAVEVTVDKVGHPQTITTLKAVDTARRPPTITPREAAPPLRLLETAIADWVFRPAVADKSIVESRVLVVGIFRPPILLTGPALGTPPVALGVGSREIPAPKATPVPAYPPDSVAEGVAVLELLVASDGRVEYATLVNEAPGFEAVTLDAARKWTFAPALRAGQPMPAFVYVVFGFRRPVS